MTGFRGKDVRKFSDKLIILREIDGPSVCGGIIETRFPDDVPDGEDVTMLPDKRSCMFTLIVFARVFPGALKRSKRHYLNIIAVG